MRGDVLCDLAIRLRSHIVACCAISVHGRHVLLNHEDARSCYALLRLSSQQQQPAVTSLPGAAGHVSDVSEPATWAAEGTCTVGGTAL